MAEEKKAKKPAGMENVAAAESRICKIMGQEGGLYYRGYDVRELAEHSKFDETSYLLWTGELPTEEQYDAFRTRLRASVELPPETVSVLRVLPRNASPLEVLRTAVSSLGHYDPDSGHTEIPARLRKAQRLAARLPAIVTAWERIRYGHEPIHPLAGHSVAFNFLYTLKGDEPSEPFYRALDVALILHAEHGFNASTFAGRVAASTLSDMYSAVTAAIGTLKGPLHGGAAADVCKMISEIREPNRVEDWVKKKLAVKAKIPGFGHRVYKVEDPRATILRESARKLSELSGDTKWFEISQKIEEVVLANTKVFPNVDFYSPTLYKALGLPQSLFTSVFAASRIVGWTAHIMEQWVDNRLIRPRGQYEGAPVRPYVQIQDREANGNRAQEQAVGV